MGTIERVMKVRNALEARLLKFSILATIVIALLGVLFGLLARSPAILFDGFFSLLDAAITWLTLVVAQLVASQGNRRFQYGYWHLEPLVILLKASVLIFLAAFAFLSSLNSILKGGYEPEFGLGMIYASVVALIAYTLWWWMRGHAMRIDSGLVWLDVKAWLMSALITSALLVAFALAMALRGTSWDWLIRYVDPAILALLSLALIPMPFREAREALAETLVITPTELDAHVRAVMDEFIARRGFAAYESYVSKSGRGRFIEISILVPASLTLAVSDYDDMRSEIGDAIGEGGPDRWLTIMFTSSFNQV
jgi:predicted Co/Zn/Cd cation transporter (cation efflux family)